MKKGLAITKKICICTMLIFTSGLSLADQLKENTAHIKQVINIPTMNIKVNPGGGGCKSDHHEKWETSQGGCSNIEWAKKTARVVSVVATPPTILANNLATSTLVAKVKSDDDVLVGAGIPTMWSTTHGTLSSTTALTNSSGESSVTLRGTIAGLVSVTASAVAGASSGNVTLLPDPSTSRIVSLVSDPSTVAADGTKANLYATVRDAYNNILPAGHPVYWSNNLNILSTDLSYTDNNGVANSTISGTTSGTATIYAKTNASDNVSTEVIFANQKPVIKFFMVTCSWQFKPWGVFPNLLCRDHSGNQYNQRDGNANVFTWEVENATRYELFGRNGLLLYSGTAKRWAIPYGANHAIDGNPWVLKAYNGQSANSPVTTINYDPDWLDVTPPSTSN